MNPFILKSGGVIASLDELLRALPAMDDATFSHHVRPDRNDFSRWIAIELNSPILAHEVRYCKTREELYRLLSRELAPAMAAAPGADQAPAAPPPTGASHGGQEASSPGQAPALGPEEAQALLGRVVYLEGQVDGFLKERESLRDEMGEYFRGKAEHLNALASQGAANTATLRQLEEHRAAIEARLRELADQIEALEMVVPKAVLEFFARIGEGRLCLDRNEHGKAADIYRELHGRFSALSEAEKIQLYGPLLGLYQALASPSSHTAAGPGVRPG